MSEESNTPDLIALTRALGAARGVEASMRFFALEPVWDGSRLGLGIYEGRDAVRGLYESWSEAFEDLEEDDQEILDFGNGVTFAASRMSGRPRSGGGAGRTHGVYGWVQVWTAGKVSRITAYPNAEEGRAAAERLAAERR
jgi:hypothetical protein